jgi:hypothetical protein
LEDEILDEAYYLSSRRGGAFAFYNENSNPLFNEEDLNPVFRETNFNPIVYSFSDDLLDDDDSLPSLSTTPRSPPIEVLSHDNTPSPGFVLDRGIYPYDFDRHIREYYLKAAAENVAKRYPEPSRTVQEEEEEYRKQRQRRFPSLDSIWGDGDYDEGETWFCNPNRQKEPGPLVACEYGFRGGEVCRRQPKVFQIPDEAESP